MGNERITEDFVRDRFKTDPLFSAIKLDEQKASVAKAKKCLAKASKNLTGKSGFPEFIISFPALPDDIIVVECKADVKFHKSEGGKNPSSLCSGRGAALLCIPLSRTQRHIYCGQW